MTKIEPKTDKHLGGYVNFPTWAVLLHIDNDPKIQETWLLVAKGSPLLPALAKHLKDHYTACKPELPMPWGEILNAGWAEIDWNQIARELLETASEVPA